MLTEQTLQQLQSLNLLEMARKWQEQQRDPQMAEIIQRHDDPQAACDALIAAGNVNGGEDNITAVLVRFEKYGD
jgi:serine/threonine protein phosphatase PrpC